MKDSRIPGMYRLAVGERVDDLERRGWLSGADADALRLGKHVLSPRVADKIVENVIGSFGLPFAIAPNFIMNGREYIVPLVVEEPSIVAGLSGAARLARETGGFEADCEESLVIGQIHLTGVGDADRSAAALAKAKRELLDAANGVHPRLVERGGGVRDVELRTLRLETGERAAAVHVLVDTCDAMGANVVNTICEAIAPRIAEITGGSVAMRILSNLADRSIVTARVLYELDDAAERDAIVRASDIAQADPYRAATHNKGVMNGIDAVAIATGNDWRAIEAGVHAYAAASGRYAPVSTWRATGDRAVTGEIAIPLKVGTVGGTLDANPAVALGLSITGADSAIELAMLMACVGLAQNFAAIRALTTTGIQKGHMRLHARSVAAAAGVPDDLFDEVVKELVSGGEVGESKAREILLARSRAGDAIDDGATAAGKFILFGEHAVVYGRHALALPIPAAVSAVATTGNDKATVTLSDWGVHHELGAGGPADGVNAIVASIAAALEIEIAGVSIHVRSRLPRAMGLGSSAAIAVAIVRALAGAFRIDLDNDRVNAIAFECEKLAHGTPSGVDNALATYGEPMLFRRGDEVRMSPVELSESPPLVIACSNSSGSTLEQVERVRTQRESNSSHYDSIFDDIDAIATEGAGALQAADYDKVGSLMNICHGLLNAIQVSTPELEHMVSLARANGAIGAKLTGAGGGGSI
ncbi:MAG: hydroxymethylglutaryl-CoA reductase, degradative, partial [Woeseiaceae bacterium]